MLLRKSVLDGSWNDNNYSYLMPSFGWFFKEQTPVAITLLSDTCKDVRIRKVKMAAMMICDQSSASFFMCATPINMSGASTAPLWPFKKNILCRLPCVMNMLAYCHILHMEEFLLYFVLPWSVFSPWEKKDEIKLKVWNMLYIYF